MGTWSFTASTMLAIIVYLTPWPYYQYGVLAAFQVVASRPAPVQWNLQRDRSLVYNFVLDGHDTGRETQGKMTHLTFGFTKLNQTVTFLYLNWYWIGQNKTKSRQCIIMSRFSEKITMGKFYKFLLFIMHFF